MPIGTAAGNYPYALLQLKDKQIAALLGKPRTTVNYQKNAALKQLRTEMEKNDEE